jgi:hypothetical protein
VFRARAAASAQARRMAWIRSGVESVVGSAPYWAVITVGEWAARRLRLRPRVSRTWRWLRPRDTSGHEGGATREGL